jgi:hypothetical protein
MEACSSYFLPRLVGFSNASYLVGTGGVFPPTSKHFGDLFNEILPESTQVLPRALQLATEIADNVSPTSQYLNRALMWHNPGTAEAAHLVESSMICYTFGSRYVVPLPKYLFRAKLCLLTQITEIRRRALERSLRNVSLYLALTLTITLRQMYHGGLRSTLVGLLKQKLRQNCNLVHGKTAAWTKYRIIDLSELIVYVYIHLYPLLAVKGTVNLYVTKDSSVINV